MIFLDQIYFNDYLKYSSNLQEFEEEIRIWYLESKYDFAGILKYADTHHKTHRTFIYNWIHVIFLIFNHKFTQNTKTMLWKIIMINPYMIMKIILG